jgi:hypothetical protein
VRRTEVRTACGSGRLNPSTSPLEINRPLPQAVLTCFNLKLEPRSQLNLPLTQERTRKSKRCRQRPIREGIASKAATRTEAD